MIDTWAVKWGIPYAAIAELKDQMGVGFSMSAPSSAKSEAEVQNIVRLRESRLGGRLWRNNVGAAAMPDGSWLRYGIANDSAAMNKKIKSSDLIGLRPVVIQPEHLGATFGLFVAREVKAPNWHYTGTERERAQLAFIELVTSLGGDAKFDNGK